MSNSKYTMTISPDAFPNAKQDKDGQVTCLAPGDELAIEIAGFKSGSYISHISFYTKESDENKDPFAIWASPLPNREVDYKSIKLFAVESTSPSTLILKNCADAGSAEQHVWFTVGVHDADGNWSLDPEVINTGGNDNRAGFVTPAPGDGSQTLS